MARVGGGGCCQCCLKFIVTGGLTALFLWLSLRTTDPTCSIQDFYVPALNKSANSTTNTTLYFDLKLDNVMKDKGIYYDALNLTFSYGPDGRSRPVGYASFPGFRQGHKKNARRKQLVGTHDVPAAAVKANGTWPVVFRVDLRTAVRFRILSWKTKRHRLVVGATVEVSDTGQKKSKKGIKLKSRAPGLGCYRAPWTQLTILFFTVLVLAFI